MARSTVFFMEVECCHVHNQQELQGVEVIKITKDIFIKESNQEPFKSWLKEAVYAVKCDKSLIIVVECVRQEFISYYSYKTSMDVSFPLELAREHAQLKSFYLRTSESHCKDIKVNTLTAISTP